MMSPATAPIMSRLPQSNDYTEPPRTDTA